MSASASPDLLLCSSQSSGSQPEKINATSQLSVSPEIHRMILKYPDEDITDEEKQELNLQEAAYQYMMQQDTQSQVTPSPFQQSQTSPHVPPTTNDPYLPDGQNTKLNQIAQKQPAQLLDGSPEYQLQISYLQEFFGTTWYFV